MQDTSTLRRCASAHTARSAIAAGFVILLLSACAAQQPQLNSERIEARFGSYSVRVLYQDSHWRISSLESAGAGGPITRTLAIVQFAESMAAELREAHRQIVSGTSIGTTFRDSGWTISKPAVYIGTFELTAKEAAVASLMTIRLPATVALHVYDFEVSVGGRQFHYARVAELHHPQYLAERDLFDLYGGPLTTQFDQDVLPTLYAVLHEKERSLVR